MMPGYPEQERCRKCKTPLCTDAEFEYGKCEDCLDKEAEASAERRDFDYWHGED